MANARDGKPGPDAEEAPTLVDAQHKSGESPAASGTSAIGSNKFARPSDRPTTREDRSTSSGSSRHGTSHGTSAITARDTLNLQEIATTRAFVRIIFVLAIVVALSMLVVSGDPTAKKIFLGSLFAVMVTSAWLGFVIRADAGYSVGRAVAAGYVCIATAMCGIWFFGVFSPAPAIIPFGLCFFSTGQSQRATLAVYLTCALAYGGLAFAIVFGALHDVGVVRSDGVGQIERITMLAIVEATFLATYAISRASRQSTLFAIEQHDKAMQAIAAREALLVEARGDLARALKAGSGNGRYTDVVLGSFKLGVVIGRGAMGEVYEAHHVDTGEEAAVKVLLDHVMSNPEHVQRFFREAKIASSLNVPNVVRVLGSADIDAAIPYIAMERLHGQDLSDYLRAHRRLSMAKTLKLLEQVGRGLDAAKAAGVVHRDLKPRNLFHAKQGKGEAWKILDFGVSKLTYEEATLTKNRLVGTPNYMAPEQIATGKVTHRTDLFALGLIAYRALTGRPAFVGEQETQLLYQVVHHNPPRPSAIASLDKAVDAVLAIALAKAVDDRFDDAASFVQALEGASRGELSPELSERAKRILDRHPWGESA